MSLLSVQDLSIAYRTAKGPVRAVDGVTFSLGEGRSLGLVGESGCGKTTLGMALMGLLPSNGSVVGGKMFFDGEDLVEMTEEALRGLRWQRIAMIFQAAMNALNPVQRIEDQIAEAILTHEPLLDKRAVLERIEELFDFVGLPESRMRDYPHQYSGGMKQRAIIAMALACRPSLIIADEPTTALDVIVQGQILAEIQRLQHELNIGILFISHDISVVAEVCHEVAVMYAGQVVEHGPREVLDAPAHPYTQALVASFPRLTGPKRALASIPGQAPNLIRVPAGCRFRSRCPIAGPECGRDAIPFAEVSPGHLVRCCKASR